MKKYIWNAALFGAAILSAAAALQAVCPPTQFGTPPKPYYDVVTGCGVTQQAATEERRGKAKVTKEICAGISGKYTLESVNVYNDKEAGEWHNSATYKCE